MHGSPRLRRWLAAAAVFPALAGAPVALAQVGVQLPGVPAEPEPEASQPEDPRQRIAASRSELAARIDALAQRLVSAAGEDALARALADEIDLVERIDRIYRQELEALERGEELARAQSAAAEKLAAGPSSGVAQAPPYALTLADVLHDALQAHASRLETIRVAAGAAAEVVADRRGALEVRERDRRRIKERAEKAKGGAEAAVLGQQLDAARLESQLAQARLELAEIELANARRQLGLQKDNHALVAATLEWVQQNLALREEDIQEPLVRLEKREFDLRRALDRTTRDLAAVERRLAGAQDRLGAAPEPSAALIAEVEARRLALQLAERRVSVLNDQLQRVAAARDLWQRRYRTLAGLSARSELREWQREIEKTLEEDDRRRRLVEARLAEIEVDRGAVRTRAEAASPPVRHWLDEQEGQLASLARLYREELASRSEAAVLADRTLAAIRGLSARVSWLERLRGLRDGIARLWDTELAAVDDRPITVGKIAGALLLFALGYAISRLISSFLGRLLTRRGALDSGAAHALQGLSFYLLLVLFFLFALRTVSIPLTAFTVLGGALAIGVGFGSQNIVNNFISGLILMAERPIKVGDIVELDSTTGRVERIGARSTRVRTFDNTHILVPNSAFLESNVINWTLSDDILRSHVDVGVAYGSPTREVDKLIHRVLEEHGKILDRPEPVVLFTDFGDNSLNFRAYFWIRVREVMDRRRIESDVRYRIDHLFRAARITIAFPQRDVHLDATRPIPVQLYPPEPNGTEDKP